LLKSTANMDQIPKRFLFVVVVLLGVSCTWGFTTGISRGPVRQRDYSTSPHQKIVDKIKAQSPAISTIKMTATLENSEALSSPQSPGKKNNKIGVILLNLGGPEKLEDVQGFLYNLFADPDIIRLPPVISALQGPIASFIANQRAPKSSEAYAAIGGGSPIMKYTRAQAEQIEERLGELGLNAKCYIAMRYWHPYTEEALAEVKRDGVDQLVILPLYPQFSISTSGSSLRALQERFVREEADWAGGRVAHTVVPAWHDRPGYVRVMGRLVREELERFTPAQRAEGPLHVLFSAHGVPQSYIDVGDPYQEQIKECVALIEREYAGLATTHLSYQSRVGPIEWLRPYTDDKIRELAAQGVKNLAVVPISFVSEHIETLEEIDMEYRELAEENGIANWRRVPAPNTDREFTDELAALVAEALRQPALTVSEACAANNCAATNDDLLGLLTRPESVRDIAATTFGLGLDALSGKGLLHLLGVM